MEYCGVGGAGGAPPLALDMISLKSACPEGTRVETFAGEGARAVAGDDGAPCTPKRFFNPSALAGDCGIRNAAGDCDCIATAARGGSEAKGDSLKNVGIGSWSGAGAF